MKRLLTIILSVFLLVHVAAQEVDSTYMARIEQMIDSVERAERVRKAVWAYEDKLLRKEMSFSPTDVLPLVSGLVNTALNRKFTQYAIHLPHMNYEIADYVPASLPLATAWTLKAFGWQSTSTLPRMATANAFALMLSSGMVYGLKHTVHIQRPDDWDNHSFPSGHSAFAFVGATILSREFGHYSPWISIGGYTLATGTQVLRIRHNAHHINDVMTGAGIGIVSTNLAYFLTDKIYGTKGIHRPRLMQGDVVRFGRFYQQPTSLSLTSGSDFGSKTLHSLLAPENCTLKISSTFSTSLEYAYYFNPYWATEVILRTTSCDLRPVMHLPHDTNADEGNTLNQYHANVAVKYSHPIGLEQRFGMRLIAGERLTERTTFRINGEQHCIPQRHAFECGAGISFSFLGTRKYVTGFAFDYLHAFSHLQPHRYYLSGYWTILL